MKIFLGLQRIFIRFEHMACTVFEREEENERKIEVIERKEDRKKRVFFVWFCGNDTDTFICSKTKIQFEFNSHLLHNVFYPTIE